MRNVLASPKSEESPDFKHDFFLFFYFLTAVFADIGPGLDDLGAIRAFDHVILL